jgi:hypothetical protein
MITCKQVSNALSKEDYEKLSPVRKFFLKVHVKLCVVCGKFNRQAMESQDMCRCYRESEEKLAPNRPKMDDLRKSELKELLSAQSSNQN